MIRYFGVDSIQRNPADGSNQRRQFFGSLDIRYIMRRACEYNMVRSKVVIVRRINIIGVRYFYDFFSEMEVVVFIHKN